MEKIMLLQEYKNHKIIERIWNYNKDVKILYEEAEKKFSFTLTNSELVHILKSLSHQIEITQSMFEDAITNDWEELEYSQWSLSKFVDIQGQIVYQLQSTCKVVTLQLDFWEMDLLISSLEQKAEAYEREVGKESLEVKQTHDIADKFFEVYNEWRMRVLK